jgi:hypothetical protein
MALRPIDSEEGLKGFRLRKTGASLKGIARGTTLGTEDPNRFAKPGQSFTAADKVNPWVSKT